MEMSVQKMMERLMALYTKTPADWFKHGQTPTLYGENIRTKVKNQLIELEQSDMPPFHIMDANLSKDVEDLAATIMHLGPSTLLVDGAYLLGTNDRSVMKSYDKIKKICLVLKQTATNLDIPVFASWQFNREAMKKGGGNRPSLENIAGGDDIGQISSVVLGLVDDPDDSRSNVAKMAYRKLHILKGRDGEAGEMELHWDFNKMDFSELDKNAPVEIYD